MQRRAARGAAAGVNVDVGAEALIDIGAVVEQLCRELAVSTRGRHRERRGAGGVVDVGIGTVEEQQRDDLVGTGLGSGIQGCTLLVVRDTRVGLGFE